MPIDFREALYALSDVIMVRPPPLRHFDQIYMKLPDMLLQAELIGRWFKGKRVVFVGDGDAIGLSLLHLSSQGVLPDSPAHIMVLDFDERVVNSVRHFAERHELRDKIGAELYNVADALPEKHWHQYDAFYTNPPWGASNNGTSVCAFIERGMEACRAEARGCIVIGDHGEHRWTHDVQVVTQTLLLRNGFRIAEMVPEFHLYHLDDDPGLRSCSIVVERHGSVDPAYNSKPLDEERLANFYGAENPLRYRFVRDLTNGGKFPSRDVELIPFDGTKKE